MSVDSDVTRAVRAWLHEDAHEDADRVLDLVLDQLDTKPQRRAGWPARRFPIMNNTTVRLGLAAAAILVIALFGLRLLPGNVGGPDVSPSATQSPSPQPIPAAGDLEPGTYLVNATAFTRMPFTVTVPQGWTRENNFIGNADDGNGVTLATWIVSHVYRDVCQWAGTLREVGSAAQLVDALSEQTGHETSGPTDATVGGLPATRLEFSVASDFDVTGCDGEFMRLWPDAGPNESFGLPIFVGQTTTVYVVDSDSGPMIVAAMRDGTSSPADVAELDAVVESIRFQP